MNNIDSKTMNALLSLYAIHILDTTGENLRTEFDKDHKKKDKPHMDLAKIALQVGINKFNLSIDDAEKFMKKYISQSMYEFRQSLEGNIK